jgi:hypothetical protein
MQSNVRPYLIPLGSWTALILGLFCTNFALTAEKSTEFSKEVAAVQQYVLNEDYPELFEGKPYRTRVENVITTDLDGDGLTDVVVHYAPHYRQSATIVIFRLSKEMKVTRVTEGLAPGPLVPVSGAFLDSHTFGMGVDMEAKSKTGEPVGGNELAQTAMKQFGGVVAYKSFIHGDGRLGKGAYIDMTHAKIPAGGKACEHFEFSKVKRVTVGKLPGHGAQNFLVAWVGNELNIYRINGFHDGFLKKTLWVEKTPSDFQSLRYGFDGALKYDTKDGQVRDLQLKLTTPVIGIEGQVLH